MKVEVLLKLRHPECEESELLSHLGELNYYDLLIAAHPNLSESGQKVVVEKGSIAAKIALLSNPGLYESVAKILVKDRSSEVKFAVAANTNMSEEVLDLFPLNSSIEIISVLIDNPNISTLKLDSFYEVLEKKGYLKNEKKGVNKYKYFFALNPKSSAKILEKISQDFCVPLKKLVLTNKNTPSWVVSDLKKEFPELAESHEKGSVASIGALLEGIEHYANKKS